MGKISKISAILIKKFDRRWKYKPLDTLQFEVHLADHCNLKCKGCNHFSCIAEEKFANYETLEHDFHRLSVLSGGVVKRLYLLGGEPLLHPELLRIILMARREFPNGEIKILTNGLLLANEPEEFWRTCGDNKIDIEYTPYPVNVQYEKITLLADKYGVNFRNCYPINKKKSMKHFVLDLDGKQNPNKSFKWCQASNDCIFLKEGRLYTCAMAPNIEIFNRRFNQQLFLTEADSIDIYKAESIDDILQFLAHPIPFCRYCKQFADMKSYEWSQSESDIKEWT